MTRTKKALATLATLALAGAALAVGTAPVQAYTQGYRYAAHVQNLGWQDAVSDYDVAGTTGQSLRLEAIAFGFIGQTARAHIQDSGWQDWRSGDTTVGTTGQSLRMEAVQIKSTIPGQEVWCQAHVQNLGWLPPVGDGEVCGTTGKALRLEAVSIWLMPVAIDDGPEPQPEVPPAPPGEWGWVCVEDGYYAVQDENGEWICALTEPEPEETVEPTPAPNDTPAPEDTAEPEEG